MACQQNKTEQVGPDPLSARLDDFRLRKIGGIDRIGFILRDESALRQPIAPLLHEAFGAW